MSPYEVELTTSSGDRVTVPANSQLEANHICDTAGPKGNPTVRKTTKKETTATPTRAQVLAGECTHREYYAAIAASAGIRYVKDGKFMDRVRAALAAGDEHLNTIPLDEWDMRSALVCHSIDAAFRSRGDFPTPAGMACLHKEAAKQAAERVTT